MGPLSSDRVRLRVPCPAPRHPRQVVAQDIDGYGRQTEKQADPDSPIAMRTSPVGTMTKMRAAVLRPFVPRVTVVTFAHRCEPSARTTPEAWPWLNHFRASPAS